MHPRIVFERLFGDGGSPEQRKARLQNSGSILDSVLEETSSLTAQLGRADTSKLHGYLDSIREVERGIAAAESKDAESLER